MIKSMTGFGRCEIMENNRKFTVELKSVNPIIRKKALEELY